MLPLQDTFQRLFIVVALLGMSSNYLSGEGWWWNN